MFRIASLLATRDVLVIVYCPPPNSPRVGRGSSYHPTRAGLTSHRLLATACCLLVALFCLLPMAHLRATEIQVQSVVLRLMDEAEVPAQEPGLLAGLRVREGARVERGDVLGQIDDRVVRIALETAELQLGIAREKAANDVQVRSAIKAHEVAQAELARSHESNRRFPNSVSQSQLDVEQLTVDQTVLEREQAEHEAALLALDAKVKEKELAAARVQLARRRIIAPFDGMVVEVFVHPGEWIEPGAKAVRIVSTTRLKAEGFVSDEQTGELNLNAPVRLTSDRKENVSGPSTTATGAIAFISPEVDPITGQVRVWAEVDNRAGKLRPGQRVRMWITDRTAALAKHDE